MENAANVRFLDIAALASPHCAEALSIYAASFPLNERQPLDVVRQRLADGRERLTVGLIGDETVCMALLWDFRGSEFVLLDYLAVAAEFRNKHAGSLLFSHLLLRFSAEGKFLVMEVEDPRYGDNREERTARVRYYLKNGAFILAQTPYILPALDSTKPTDMLLMIAPAYPGGVMGGARAEALIRRLYSELYGRNEEDPLLRSFIARIPEKIYLTQELPR